jgi:hypothetical protein
MSAKPLKKENIWIDIKEYIPETGKYELVILENYEDVKIANLYRLSKEARNFYKSDDTIWLIDNECIDEQFITFWRRSE